MQRNYKKKGKGKGKASGGFGGAQGQMQASVQQGGTIARSMPLFGYRKRVTLPYMSMGNFATGANVASAYVFSANVVLILM